MTEKEKIKEGRKIQDKLGDKFFIGVYCEKCNDFRGVYAINIRTMCCKICKEKMGD